MSPRRSSRARQTQLLRPNSTQSGSSSSASSYSSNTNNSTTHNANTDHHTHNNNNNNNNNSNNNSNNNNNNSSSVNESSNHNHNHNHRISRTSSSHDTHMKSATPTSSSDEPERPQPLETEARQTRQKKREQDIHDGLNGDPLEPDLPDEEADDGEVTRCICGQQDYPGPPEHVIGRPCINQRVQDNLSKTNPDAHPHPLLFESGSLFIQCETCHVWQHGGCVGIMDEAMSPEHYYCEECKDALHKIYIEPSGRKYSKFTRAYQDWECTRPSVTSKKSIYYETQTVYHLLANAERATSAAISNAKRRSTMNSRAAADEEEALLKAIEESKSDGKSGATGSGSRRAKRGREDSSEEMIQELKRRKTGSESGSPSVFPTESAAAGSETDGPSTKSRSANLLKKGRGTAGQLTREAIARERDRDRERERTESAPRRRGKVEKRRGEEVEFLDDQNRSQDMSRLLPTSNRPAGATTTSKQPINATTQAGHSASRRGVKSGARRGRAGRSQNIKDREAGTESKHDSPQASYSRDSEDVVNSDGHGPNTLGNGSKPSKPRHMNPNRTSMNDLRKRAAGILEYISRTQVEIAGDKTPPNQESKTKGSTGVAALARLKESRVRTRASDNGSVVLSTSLDSTDDLKTDKSIIEAAEGGAVDEAAFRELNSLQMMDILTRELVMWQRMYGKFGER